METTQTVAGAPSIVGVSPRTIKPLLFLLPKPSPVPGHSYLGSE